MNPIDPFANNWPFVMVFDWVLDAGLSLPYAYTYGLLARYRGRGAARECYPSMATLSRQLGMNERDVRRRIAQLEARGLIRRLERRGDTNLYVLYGPDAPPFGSPGVAVPDRGAEPGVPGARLADPSGDVIPVNKTLQIKDQILSGGLARAPAESVRPVQLSVRGDAGQHRAATVEAQLAEAERAGDAARQKELRKLLKTTARGGRHA